MGSRVLFLGQRSSANASAVPGGTYDVRMHTRHLSVALARPCASALHAGLFSFAADAAKAAVIFHVKVAVSHLRSPLAGKKLRFLFIYAVAAGY